MLDEKALAREEKDWAKNKQLLKRKIKIEKDKAKLRNSLKDKSKLTTTKLLILFLFINCTIIELFTGWATIQSIQLTMQYMRLNPQRKILRAELYMIVH